MINNYLYTFSSSIWSNGGTRGAGFTYNICYITERGQQLLELKAYQASCYVKPQRLHCKLLQSGPIITSENVIENLWSQGDIIMSIVISKHVQLTVKHSGCRSYLYDQRASQTNHSAFFRKAINLDKCENYLQHKKIKAGLCWLCVYSLKLAQFRTLLVCGSFYEKIAHSEIRAECLNRVFGHEGAFL